MTHKYQIELFEGDWGIQIGEYDNIKEAEEEYENWNDSKKLYEERKERLYDSNKRYWFYKPWTRRGAQRIQKTMSISIFLNEQTYDKNGKLIYDEYDEPTKIIKSIYYSGSDFLEDYRKENESNED